LLLSYNVFTLNHSSSPLTQSELDRLAESLARNS